MCGEHSLSQFTFGQSDGCVVTLVDRVMPRAALPAARLTAEFVPFRGASSVRRRRFAVFSMLLLACSTPAAALPEQPLQLNCNLVMFSCLPERPPGVCVQLNSWSIARRKRDPATQYRKKLDALLM